MMRLWSHRHWPNQLKVFPVLAGIWLVSLGGLAATPKLTVVPKWHPFEQEFRSSIAYAHPLQEATLTVRFVSPLGDTYTVFGFWDGGKTWRVRFAPDQPGEWRFQATCTDSSNRGLNGQTGAFLCTAALGGSRFDLHGPVRLARAHRHLEHADGTPFFWLADTVWNGALVSEPKDWDLYAQVRASQGFNVAQWAVAPGLDFKQESPITGFPDQVNVNPDVFRRLDAKVETLNHAGILSAIVPMLEGQTNAMSLHQDQAVLLLRYVVARWGAEPAFWLMTLGGTQASPPLFKRWTDIARDGFQEGSHSPVIAFCGDNTSLLAQLASEQWPDILGFKPVRDMTPQELRVSFEGAFGNPLSRIGQPRPWLVATPYENALTPNAHRSDGSAFPADKAVPPGRFTADDVRKSAYWGLQMVTPAGVSYGGYGVINWDRSQPETKDPTPGANLPLWHRALFMPGAKQMGRLERFYSSLPFWRLEPQPAAIANQPGDSDPQREVAAAGTASKDLLLVYVPQDRSVELNLDAMPVSPAVTWFNPRTGVTSPAVAVVVARTCQFPTPEPGDWLLVVKKGK